MENEIIFLTGNKKKFDVAKKYFGDTELNIEQLDCDVPEIQDLSPEKVVSFSVKYMADKLNKPVIKSDQSFMIDILNGFPGTYMKDVESMLDVKGFYQIMNNQADRRCKFVEVLAFCEPNCEPVFVRGECLGTLSNEIRGDEGYGVDFLFIPKGSDRTLAQMSKEDRINVYDFKLWPKLIEKVEDKFK